MSDGRDELDSDRLAELRALDGTGAMLDEMIDTMRSTCVEMLDRLGRELDEGRLGDARETTHTLAGRALMVGARTAGEQTREMEHRLAAGDAEGALDRWPQVRAAFDRAVQALAEHRSA